MTHEIEVLEEAEYVRILRAKAEAHERHSARIAASFGTQVEPVRYLHNKAVGYQMLADVIAANIKPQL